MRNPLQAAAATIVLLATVIPGASALPANIPVKSTSVTIDAQHVSDRHRSRHDFRHRREILPPYVIIRSLRHRGYERIRMVDRRYGNYIMIARGYRGPVRLVVSARNARIISRYPLHRHWRRHGIHIGGGNTGFSYSVGIR